MKYYSFNEQNNELLINTLRDFDYLDAVTPSYPIHSVIADVELPVLNEKEALIVVGERASYKYSKNDIEITINNVMLASQNLQVVEDHRGEKYFSTKDGSEIEIKEIGKLPDTITTKPRPSIHHSFINGEWVEDVEAREQAEKEQKEEANKSFLSSETRRVNDAIAPLDDAIEFEIATEEEIAHHKGLRKYRLLLSRVSSQVGWPLEVEWPERPKFF